MFCRENFRTSAVDKDKRFEFYRKMLELASSAPLYRYHNAFDDDHDESDTK